MKHFNLEDELTNAQFIKDNTEDIWYRPRDGFSIKFIKANNGKNMFTLMNFKRPGNKHIATMEIPYNLNEFEVLMKKLGVLCY